MAKCEACNRFYKNAQGLRQHLRHTHGIYQTMVKDMFIPENNI